MEARSVLTLMEVIQPWFKVKVLLHFAIECLHRSVKEVVRIPPCRCYIVRESIVQITASVSPSSRCATL